MHILLVTHYQTDLPSKRVIYAAFLKLPWVIPPNFNHNAVYLTVKQHCPAKIAVPIGYSPVVK
jgi:hypothetical protein